MPLHSKPDIVTVLEAVEETDANGVVQVVIYASAGQLACQVSPMTAEAAFRHTGVQLNQPHKLLADVDDAPRLAVGNRLRLGDVTYVVKAPPMVFRNSGPAAAANHCSVVIEELQYATG